VNKLLLLLLLLLPERTTLYRARLIFGFEHLPPIRGGPHRARKRFNYFRFVLLDLYELYLIYTLHVCIHYLIIWRACAASPHLLLVYYYIKYTILVSLQPLSAARV
jgi:hypothetical protein